MKKIMLIVAMIVTACGSSLSPQSIEQCGKSCKGEGTTMKTYSNDKGCECMVIAPSASNKQRE